MAFYPIFLRLQGEPCLVIGGGDVAERKVAALRRAGARITVVSPTLTPGLTAMAAESSIRHQARRYETGDLVGFRLAFAAVNDDAAERQISQDARKEGVALNVADQPQLCSFIAPAVLQQGDLTIAVSTGGASPALARRIREQLSESFGQEYAQALTILRAVRQQLRAQHRPASERQQILTNLVRSELLEFLREGKPGEVDRLLSSTVGDGTSVARLGVTLS